MLHRAGRTCPLLWAKDERIQPGVELEERGFREVPGFAQT